MIKRLFSSQLRINMASGTVTTVINAAVMVIAYPIYLHFLGYEKYGVWLVLTTVLTFAKLGDVGISQAIMKLVAEDYGRDDISYKHIIDVVGKRKNIHQAPDFTNLVSGIIPPNPKG